VEFEVSGIPVRKTAHPSTDAKAALEIAPIIDNSRQDSTGLDISGHSTAKRA
jgi:hypothetical protein